ncbi:MAG: hypothetical protein ABL995_17490 [Bryobacteraceae bacterium]
MSRRILSSAAVTLLLLAASSCSRSSEAALRRTAILPVENLTGDSSVDWIGTAASSILTNQTRSAVGSNIFAVPALREAYARNAERVVHGYATYANPSRPGKDLKLSFVIEDLATKKTQPAVELQGNVLDALNRFAHTLVPNAGTFSTANVDAMTAWASGDFSKAVELDPNFGQAWLSLLRKQAFARDMPGAQQTAERALAQKSLRNEYDRLEITGLLAELRKDYRGRAQAYEALAALTPSDMTAAIAAAQAQTLARNFQAAAALYRKVVAAEPANFGAMNSLGYAEAMAGNLDGSKRAFETYAKQPGQAVNAIDSLGEAHFMNGKFREAASFFQQAFTRDPKFAEGQTLVKAAYAQWLAGDLPGADKLFSQYSSQHADNAAALVEASWLYSTGREEQARAELASAPPILQAAVQRQLALWNSVKESVRQPPSAAQLLQRKDAYESTMPPKDAETRTFYAFALAASGRLDDARALVQQWPLPTVSSDPFSASLVFPQFIATRRKTGL